MSFHPSARCNPNVLTPTENTDEPLHGPNMTNETSYKTARLSSNPFAEEAETMVLWTQELVGVDRGEVYENKDELIENEGEPYPVSLQIGHRTTNESEACLMLLCV